MYFTLYVGGGPLLERTVVTKVDVSLVVICERSGYDKSGNRCVYKFDKCPMADFKVTELAEDLDFDSLPYWDVIIIGAGPANRPAGK